MCFSAPLSALSIDCDDEFKNKSPLHCAENRTSKEIKYLIANGKIQGRDKNQYDSLVRIHKRQRAALIYKDKEIFSKLSNEEKIEIFSYVKQVPLKHPVFKNEKIRLIEIKDNRPVLTDMGLEYLETNKKVNINPKNKQEYLLESSSTKSLIDKYYPIDSKISDVELGIASVEQKVIAPDFKTDMELAIEDLAVDQEGLNPEIDIDLVGGDSTSKDKSVDETVEEETKDNPDEVEEEKKKIIRDSERREELEGKESLSDKEKEELETLKKRDLKKESEKTSSGKTKSIDEIEKEVAKVKNDLDQAREKKEKIVKDSKRREELEGEESLSDKEKEELKALKKRNFEEELEKVDEKISELESSVNTKEDSITEKKKENKEKEIKKAIIRETEVGEYVPLKEGEECRDKRNKGYVLVEPLWSVKDDKKEYEKICQKKFITAACNEEIGKKYKTASIQQFSKWGKEISKEMDEVLKKLANKINDQVEDDQKHWGSVKELHDMLSSVAPKIEVEKEIGSSDIAFNISGFPSKCISGLEAGHLKNGDLYAPYIKNKSKKHLLPKDSNDKKSFLGKCVDEFIKKSEKIDIKKLGRGNVFSRMRDAFRSGEGRKEEQVKRLKEKLSENFGVSSKKLVFNKGNNKTTLIHMDEFDSNKKACFKNGKKYSVPLIESDDGFADVNNCHDPRKNILGEDLVGSLEDILVKLEGEDYINDTRVENSSAPETNLNKEPLLECSSEDMPTENLYDFFNDYDENLNKYKGEIEGQSGEEFVNKIKNNSAVFSKKLKKSASICSSQNISSKRKEKGCAYYRKVVSYVRKKYEDRTTELKSMGRAFQMSKDSSEVKLGKDLSESIAIIDAISKLSPLKGEEESLGTVKKKLSSEVKSEEKEIKHCVARNNILNCELDYKNTKKQLGRLESLKKLKGLKDKDDDEISYNEYEVFKPLEIVDFSKGDDGLHERIKFLKKRIEKLDKEEDYTEACKEKYKDEKREAFADDIELDKYIEKYKDKNELDDIVSTSADKLYTEQQLRDAVNMAMQQQPNPNLAAFYNSPMMDAMYMNQSKMYMNQLTTGLQSQYSFYSGVGGIPQNQNSSGGNFLYGVFNTLFSRSLNPPGNYNYNQSQNSYYPNQNYNSLDPYRLNFENSY